MINVNHPMKQMDRIEEAALESENDYKVKFTSTFKKKL